MRKIILIIVIVVIGLLMGGCNPGPSDASNTVEERMSGRWHDDELNVTCWRGASCIPDWMLEEPVNSPAVDDIGISYSGIVKTAHWNEQTNSAYITIQQTNGRLTLYMLPDQAKNVSKCSFVEYACYDGVRDCYLISETPQACE